MTDAASWSKILADDDNEHSNRETLVVRLLAKESNSSLGYKNNRWEKNIRLSSQGGSGGKGAPIELIDVFPMADGTLPDAAHQVTEGSLRFMENIKMSPMIRSGLIVGELRSQLPAALPIVKE